MIWHIFGINIFWMKRFLLITMLLWGGLTFAQPVPSKEENIPFLVTFGKEADKSWGDDDF